MARHFAPDAWDNVEDDSVESGIVAGKHAKHLTDMPFVAPDPIPSLVAEMPVNDKADLAARSYVDQLLMELEAELATRTPEPVVVVAPAAEPEPDLEPEPKGLDLDEPEPLSAPEPAHKPKVDGLVPPVLQSWPKEPAASKAEPVAEPAAKDVSEEAASTPRQPRHYSGVAAQIVANEKPTRPDELDDTIELVRIEQPESDEPGEGDARERSVRGRARLEASASVSMSAPSVPAPPRQIVQDTQQPHFSFFARIGAFVARLLHLDES